MVFPDSNSHWCGNFSNVIWQIIVSCDTDSCFVPIKDTEGILDSEIAK